MQNYLFCKHILHTSTDKFAKCYKELNLQKYLDFNLPASKIFDFGKKN